MAKAKTKKKSALYRMQQIGLEGGICPRCNHPTFTLTVDHIVPVSILSVLDDTGEAIYEDEENMELICHPCNKFKGHNLDKKNPLTKKILLKYL
jgi:5-methylcytosine-specific restriction endonuclease McrA